MEKIDIEICPQKRSKNKKNIKNKDIEKQKALEIINEIISVSMSKYMDLIINTLLGFYYY